MKAFLTQKEAARKRKAHAIACNPAPGRPSKHYHRITRTLDLVTSRISANLVATEFADLKWLPYEGVVHERDDEWQYDLHAQVHPEDHKPEDDGHMPTWTDPGIKATNRIMAVTWYDDGDGDAFIIKKPVLCPLPCNQWGRLPITLAQWRRIAMVLIESERRWRWVHAVRHYTDNNNMVPAGIAGWHLETTQAVTSMNKLAAEGKGYIIDMRSPEERDQDSNSWPGRNLYLDIIAGFSLDD
jgi:hypothetical protein